MKRAAEAGTPFLSLFSPQAILDLGKDAGFQNSKIVLAQEIYERYFANRSDGLRAGEAEAFLIAQI